MSTIAPRIATEASATRAVSGSDAKSHPSSTATTGFAYVCVATNVGGHRCSSHVYAVNATIDPKTIRNAKPKIDLNEIADKCRD